MLESDLNALKNAPEFKSKLFGISRIQRYLRVHYNRAARLVDVAIERGILVRDTEQQHLLKLKQV